MSFVVQLGRVQRNSFSVAMVIRYSWVHAGDVFLFLARSACHSVQVFLGSQTALAGDVVNMSGGLTHDEAASPATFTRLRVFVIRLVEMHFDDLCSLRHCLPHGTVRPVYPFGYALLYVMSMRDDVEAMPRMWILLVDARSVIGAMPPAAAALMT